VILLHESEAEEVGSATKMPGTAHLKALRGPEKRPGTPSLG
jgi:hypothetical protein